MNAKKKSRKVTSPEAPTSSHRRGAIGWLERVAAESPHPTARRAAKEDVTSWDRLVESWRTRHCSTRRSLADILAGASAKDEDQTSTLKSGKREFVFHIWAEARERRGLPVISGAINAGLPMHERTAQKGRWGRKLRT